METGAPLWTPVPVSEISLASVVCLAPMKPFMAPVGPRAVFRPLLKPEEIFEPPVDRLSPALSLRSIFSICRIAAPVIIALSGVPI